MNLRIAALLLDVPAERLDAAVRFRSGLLGAAAEPTDPPASYTSLPPGLSGPGGELAFDVQRVDDDADTTIGPAPRHHVDLAARDVATEVTRLEGLGAERVAEVENLMILRDPAGLPFCVVPAV